MERGFDLFPQQASAEAAQVDQLYFFLVANAFFFTGLICVLILFFVIRYRRASRANRSGAPTHGLGLELLWSFIPLAIMMVSFGWGAKLYVQTFQIPEDAIDIAVVGKQWMWRIYHAEGRREINELHIPVGQAVRLKMISEDVIHSFYVPAFRVKQDVLPGRYTHLWFKPTRTGQYHLFCAEYCGTSHALMRGRVVVMEPEEYAAWIADQAVEPAEQVGQRLFERYRCDSCHGNIEAPKGPPLAGLPGSTVTLADGQSVTADMSYIRRSILEPAAQVVAGYEPRMPTYKGQLSEEDILQLTAYIKSLSVPDSETSPQQP